MNGISLIQLAKMAGVSKTTASLIVNNKSEQHKISKKTKEKVLALAQEHGYKPNRLALNLSTGQSHLVGVVLPDLRLGDYASLLEALERVLGGRGYRLLVGFHKEQANIEAALIDDFLEQQVDGLLLVSTGNNQKQLLQARSKGVAIVLLERTVEEVELPLVTYNANEAVSKLISYWYVRNRRAIAYVGQEGTSAVGRTSYRKYYCERFSMKRHYDQCVPFGHSAKATGALVKELLDQGVTAILFESPALLLEGYKVLQADGRAGANDVALGVFGWHEFIDLLAISVGYIPLKANMLASLVVETWEAYKENAPGTSQSSAVILDDVVFVK
jgi:DNA-binding LacI/PurR family transcriptional regulator